MLQEAIFYYNYNYDRDVKITYTRNDGHGRTELTLEHPYEDDPRIAEEIIIGGKVGEPLKILAQEQKDEISEYIDMCEGEGEPDENYLNEYSREALYAFEYALGCLLKEFD